jgi:hypothetical protein
VFRREVDHRFFADRDWALRLLLAPAGNCEWAKTQAVRPLIVLARLASSILCLAAWFRFSPCWAVWFLA